MLNETSSPGLSARPDLLVFLEKPERLLVLDAKDYAEGTWPHSADIFKQMVYRLLGAAATELPLDRVGNAFLFPGEGAPLIRRRGTHVLDRTVPDLPGLGSIPALEVDLPRVMDAYRSGRVDRGIVGAVESMLLADFPGLAPASSGPPQHGPDVAVGGLSVKA